MKFTNISLWLIVLTLIVSLASCDPLSSVEYKIYNLTEDTVSVSFYKEIMASSYGGYAIEENDSVTTYYTAQDSIYVATLAPKQSLVAKYEWNGLYREEYIVPAWRYMKSITKGGAELDSLSWGTESAWTVKTSGGGFGEGESRYYQLLIRDKSH